MSDSILTFVSYNITQSKTLYELILEYLSNQTDTILFLQEVKPTFTLDRNKYNVAPVRGQKRMSDLRVYASSNLDSFCIKCNSQDRYQILQTKNGYFANVHMPSSWRNGMTEGDRYGKLAKKIRSNFELDLIGGDINANPFEEAVFSPSAWFAKRTLDDFTRYRDKGLINPFWQIFNSSAKEDSFGSFPGSMNHFSRRQILDQFFVPTSKHDKIIDVGILKEILGVSFETINSKKEVKADKGRGKLHWPVFIKYKIGD